MKWLTDGFPSLQLDIVGFLAILGEGSVTANAQVSLLSNFALLPRLLPAPQALIRTARPRRLHSSVGEVIGAFSGNYRPSINHVANLVHSHDHLPDYTVRCDIISKPVAEKTVHAKTWGPINIVEILGTAMSVALLVLSAIRSDGFGLMATLLLSCLSTMIGIGSRWSLALKARTAKRDVPKDCIVIKYPNGAFRIIKCDESIARELYWHPEACHYVYSDTVYRLISLVGTITLMIGVICLANSTIELQTAFAAAYIILNMAYWTVAALPDRWHWDLSAYVITPEIYDSSRDKHSFTWALWKAIAIIGSSEWVTQHRVAPVTNGWKRWLEVADEQLWIHQEKCKAESPTENGLVGTPYLGRTIADWDPEAALTHCLNPNTAEKKV